MTGASSPTPDLTLTPDDVRLITLRAQGLIGTAVRRGGVPAMLRRIGAVQLDTISVLARSHELVAYARLGHIPRTRIERAYWNPGTADAFEYWSHAACVLPIEEWPNYVFRRRLFRARGLRWHQSHPDVCAEVLARIRSEGPLTATQLGGAKNGGAWWDWSDTKIAVEWLLDTGDVICARRSGWRRVYDLPERVLPAELLNADRSNDECFANLAATAGRALGVVTSADLVDYQRIGRKAVGKWTAAQVALAGGLIPVRVSGPDGSGTDAWADPAALDSAAAGSGHHRVTLLSPFDSVLWDRKRTRRMFGFEHSLEAYVPSGKRVHGYFTMPLLARGKLIGWVDPARSGRTLIARTLSLNSAAAAGPMARALTEAAAWVGCDSVRIDQLRQPQLMARLTAELAAFS